jgi:NAD(P)-dependent dehydrogenase (short-subunit alcohol dehydrogenase family)
VSPELLRGRRALVTGAAGGIGAAVRHAFEAAGAAVVGVDAAAGDDVLQCDVTDDLAVARAFDVASESGPVTDVVHAAGVASVAPIRDVSLDVWEHVIRVNLTGSFVVAREAARRLSGGGSLTLVSSQAGLRGGARWSAYCASKFGVIGLMQCVAQELAPQGVRVNAVCPGAVATRMTDTLVDALAGMEGIEPEELHARYEAGAPIGRYAEPAEIAQTCVFLASDMASYVAGSSLVIDGGELTA